MDPNISFDITFKLPKNICLLIFEYVSKIHLISNKEETKKEEKKNLPQKEFKSVFDFLQSNPPEEQVLEKKMEEEEQFKIIVIQLNKLKRVNKNWNKFLSSLFIWQKICLHLDESIPNVLLPPLPVSFSFFSFQQYFEKRKSAIGERINELMEENYLEED